MFCLGVLHSLWSLTQDYGDLIFCLVYIGSPHSHAFFCFVLTLMRQFCSAVSTAGARAALGPCMRRAGCFSPFVEKDFSWVSSKCDLLIPLAAEPNCLWGKCSVWSYWKRHLGCGPDSSPPLKFNWKKKPNQTHNKKHFLEAQKLKS